MSNEERAARKTRAAGLALIVGVIIAAVAPFLLPGGFLIWFRPI